MNRALVSRMIGNAVGAAVLAGCVTAWVTSCGPDLLMTVMITAAAGGAIIGYVNHYEDLRPLL